MNKYLVILLLAASFSCNRTEQSRKPIETIKRLLPTTNTVKVYEYPPMSIPDFFTALINNHQQDYLQFAKVEYLELKVRYLGVISHSIDTR